MIPPHNSLVKYDNPILVSTNKSSSSKNKGSGKDGKDSNKDDKKEKKSSTNAAGEGRHTSQTEDILNSILPPREWTEDGQLWVQYVSSTPATRLDVINLQENLDHKLQLRQSRETGICPIREELYAQCFDELIRQVTINCAERGLLLLRVRDEIRMTTASYQTLYESSISFGMRKSLSSSIARSVMSKKIQTLQSETKDLSSQVKELTLRIEQIKQKEIERSKEEKIRHEEEVGKLKGTNEMLKASLEGLLAAPKK